MSLPGSADAGANGGTVAKAYTSYGDAVDATKGAPTTAATTPGSTLGSKMEGIGALWDAMGSVIDGYNQAAMLKRQASVADANVIATNRNAATVADSVLRIGRASLGAQSAAVAENGLGFSGSVLDTIGQSAINVQADANKAIYGGVVKAIDFENEASAARAAAKNAVTAGWIGAGSKLIKGVGQAMTMGGGG